MIHTGVQVERQMLAGDEEILVVNGKRGRAGLIDRERLSLVRRGSKKRKTEEREQQFVHGSFPLVVVYRDESLTRPPGQARFHRLGGSRCFCQNDAACCVW